MRSLAILYSEHDDEKCFLWSILLKLYPSKESHPYRVSNHRQSFNELNIQKFDISNGFECSDFQKFEKFNKLSQKFLI